MYGNLIVIVVKWIFAAHNFSSGEGNPFVFQ